MEKDTMRQVLPTGEVRVYERAAMSAEEWTCVSVTSKAGAAVPSMVGKTMAQVEAARP